MNGRSLINVRALAFAVIVVFLAVVLTQQQTQEKIITSLDACNASQTDKNVTMKYAYYLGVDQNFFGNSYLLIQKGPSSISGGTWIPKVGYECYLEMTRVCDTQNICQNYAKRFVVDHNSLMEWCDGKCNFQVKKVIFGGWVK